MNEREDSSSNLLFEIYKLVGSFRSEFPFDPFFAKWSRCAAIGTAYTSMQINCGQRGAAIFLLFYAKKK